MVEVPDELVSEFRQRYHVDMSPVRVYRGARASAATRALRARAYTADGQIGLPATAGPLDRPPARRLLAHELTHVIQQRAFGPALPGESTPLGRLLEAQAVHNERSAGGPFPTNPRPPAPPPPTPLASGPMATGPLATAPITGGLAPSPGLVQRAPEGPVRPASEPPPELDAFMASTFPAGITDRYNEPPAGEPRTFPDRHDDLAARTEQLDARLADLAELVEQHTGPGRPIDLTDPNDLAELTHRLYPRLRSQLRQELLVDRERAGRLADL